MRSWSLLADQEAPVARKLFIIARRGIYRSVAALRAEITSFIEHHNADPKPFRWTKSAEDILSSIERFCAYNFQPRLKMPRTSGSGH
jgi:hypothetical protein